MLYFSSPLSKELSINRFELRVSKDVSCLLLLIVNISKQFFDIRAFQIGNILKYKAYCIIKVNLPQNMNLLKRFLLKGLTFAFKFADFIDTVMIYFLSQIIWDLNLFIFQELFHQFVYFSQW